MSDSTPQEDWSKLVLLSLSPHSEDRERAIHDAIALYRSAKSPLGRTSLRAILRVGLTDRDFSVRLIATDEIGTYGRASDALGLKDRLRDPEWPIRAGAASALASLLKRRARPMLLSALEDPDPIVRRYAAVALFDALGDEAISIVRAFYDRETDDLARVGMDSVLASAGHEDARQRLVRFSRSPYPSISSPAIKALQGLEKT